MLCRMLLTLGTVLAALAGAVHVLIFVLESVLFERPEVHARFRTRTEDVAAVRPWAFNQGFYNLFLAIGAGVGVVLVATGSRDVGAALVLLACGSMVAAALVLVATDRRMARAALTQGLLPALAVVLTVAALG
jgi:putative membrane protein